MGESDSEEKNSTKAKKSAASAVGLALSALESSIKTAIKQQQQKDADYQNVRDAEKKNGKFLKR